MREDSLGLTCRSAIGARFPNSLLALIATLIDLILEGYTLQGGLYSRPLMEKARYKDRYQTHLNQLNELVKVPVYAAELDERMKFIVRYGL